MFDDLDFELTDEQRMARDSARQFAAERLKPVARAIDRDHHFPLELLPELGAHGFLGINVPEAYGGSGMDTVAYALIIEELARVCASTSVIVSAHNSLCIAPILAFGSEDQKQRYLPKLASGEWVGCFALSEPGTGSDAARQTCLAKPSADGSEWRVSGMKNWITNAPIADLCVMLTMERPEEKHRGVTAFLVEMKNTPGVSVGRPEDKLGICGSPTASITMSDVMLGVPQRLGASGDGFHIAMKTLDGGRIGIAAQATGIAAAALADSIHYAKDRQTFGKPIADHQSIQNYLADMSCRIDAARLLTFHAARRKDRGLPYTRNAAEAKLAASETAMWCTTKGIQIHGGYGYVRDFNVERYFRDAKITEIYEGTSEIQRLVIAGQLTRG